MIIRALVIRIDGQLVAQNATYSLDLEDSYVLSRIRYDGKQLFLSARFGSWG